MCWCTRSKPMAKDKAFLGAAHLPRWISGLIVSEVLLDPLVDGRERHLVLVLLHGHPNQGCVAVRGLHAAVDRVVDVVLLLL